MKKKGVKFTVTFHEVNVKISGEIYTPKYYDKIFSEIKKLPISMSAEDISKEIQKRINLTIVFIEPPYTPDILSTLDLFRLRVLDLGQKSADNEEEPSSYSYPPNPEIGRANLAGQQVFYASGDKHTPYIEMNEKIIEGESIAYFSRWRINPEAGEVSIRNLFLGIKPSETSLFSSAMAKGLQEALNTMMNRIPEKHKKHFIYGQRKYAELFRVKGKSLYHITSAIANSTFETFRKQGGDVPILTYPSVAKGGKDVNFAIRKDFADNFLELQEVHKVKIQKVGEKVIGFEVIQRANVVNGKVNWQNSHIKAECTTAFISTDGKLDNAKNINVDDVFIFDGDNNKYRFKDILRALYPGNSITDFAAENLPIPVGEYKGPLQTSILVPVDFSREKLYHRDSSLEENRVNHMFFPVKFTFSFVEDHKKAG